MRVPKNKINTTQTAGRGDEASGTERRCRREKGEMPAFKVRTRLHHVQERHRGVREEKEVSREAVCEAVLERGCFVKLFGKPRCGRAFGDGARDVGGGDGARVCPTRESRNVCRA